MREALNGITAAPLSIKCCFVFIVSGADGTVVCGPGDLELHKGHGDNRYYALDFARLLPPEAPRP